MNHGITGAAEDFAIHTKPERTEENTQQAEYTMIYFFLLASSSSRCKEKVRQQLQLGKIAIGDYLGGTQLALAFVPSTELGVAEGLGSIEAALLLGDFAWRLGDEWRWKGQVDAGGSSVEVITLCRFEQ
jgi:hypothetical protein